ncbi:GspE/PulE family protein, partial [Patescibacteria group bacterium]|nr:GspE/PulE family protein [Patescibacteria group bacterium]
QEYQEVLQRAAHKPFGMILTTGPTGSGKSTTLYALLKMRNFPDVNISTIEDPVEYKIAGINHIQVNNKAELTFASGLRALVRQDPDILLVGEIRDGETADISVNAALTGHLLFSTLHANDAATAVPRLLEMGVEPFLLASTLEIVIGQRLVRRICPQCRHSYSLEAEEAKKLFPGADKFFTGSDPVTLYRGKGCEGCGDTGYRGRVGIYELLEITKGIEDLIIARATSADINNAACKGGMRLMFGDGFEKVRTGMTTMEELLRVAAPPEIIFSPSDDKR